MRYKVDFNIWTAFRMHRCELTTPKHRDTADHKLTTFVLGLVLKMDRWQRLQLLHFACVNLNVKFNNRNIAPLICTQSLPFLASSLLLLYL